MSRNKQIQLDDMFLHLCGFGRGFGDSGRFRAKVPQKYGTLSTPLDNLKTRCDPHMALIPGRNRLTCFYCGVKSSQRQDGHTRRWECRSCESVNYLDEVSKQSSLSILVVWLTL